MVSSLVLIWCPLGVIGMETVESFPLYLEGEAMVVLCNQYIVPDKIHLGCNKFHMHSHFDSFCFACL